MTEKISTELATREQPLYVTGNQQMKLADASTFFPQTNNGKDK